MIYMRKEKKKLTLIQKINVTIFYALLIAMIVFSSQKEINSIIRGVFCLFLGVIGLIEAFNTKIKTKKVFLSVFAIVCFISALALLVIRLNIF